MNYNECKKKFIKQIEKLAISYRVDDVFTDFVEYVALSFHCNLILSDEAKKHQTEIERIRKKYPENFYVDLLKLIGEALNDRFGDFLGECYHDLSVQSSSRQQFFTPYSISKITAKTIFPNEEKIKQQINNQGYISINEPSCGGGGLLIACLEQLKELNINYQKDVLIIAQDVDYRCIYMCYVVMCILCAPAIIKLGNTLKTENKLELKTPFYWLNFYKFNSDLRNP